MKRYALILALVMALAAGFGCAKKTTSEPGYDDGLTPEMRAAIQQITDARVYFAFDKFDIKPEYKEMLKTKADLMKKYSSIRVRIEGNCDERGTQEYNLALGQKRAEAVKKQLILLGAREEQVESVSLGEEKPKNPGQNEAAWAENRRGDMLYSGEFWDAGGPFLESDAPVPAAGPHRHAAGAVSYTPPTPPTIALLELPGVGVPHKKTPPSL